MLAPFDILLVRLGEKLRNAIPLAFSCQRELMWGSLIIDSTILLEQIIGLIVIIVTFILGNPR